MRKTITLFILFLVAATPSISQEIEELLTPERGWFELCYFENAPYLLLVEDGFTYQYLLIYDDTSLGQLRGILTKFFEWHEIAVSNDLEGVKKIIPLNWENNRVVWANIGGEGASFTDDTPFSFRFVHESGESFLELLPQFIKAENKPFSFLNFKTYTFTYDQVEKIQFYFSDEGLKPFFESHKKEMQVQDLFQ